jgi:hypothetical protein
MGRYTTRRRPGGGRRKRSEVIAMKLQLRRTVFTEKSTIGELYVDGRFECYTLEDRVRPVKIPKQTAIPMGVYRVEVNQSGHFKRLMPQVMDVPNFTWIRIHPGNTAEDTEGCILVGQVRGENRISKSRAAYEALFKKIKAAWDRKEPISIEVQSDSTIKLEEFAKALRNICLPDATAVRSPFLRW